jgi:hypothetical protein
MFPLLGELLNITDLNKTGILNIFNPTFKVVHRKLYFAPSENEDRRKDNPFI